MARREIVPESGRFEAPDVLILVQLAFVQGKYQPGIGPWMEVRLNSVDKRLADVNAHLIDQSRGIDETSNRIINDPARFLRFGACPQAGKVSG